MKTGLRTGIVSVIVDNKELRRFNAETARMAVLEYLKTKANISETARMFGITRA
jgi:transposase-like protein